MIVMSASSVWEIPTHEEIITDLIRNNVKSYKELSSKYLSNSDKI